MSQSNFSLQPAAPTPWAKVRQGRGFLVAVLILAALVLSACLSLLSPSAPARTPVVLPAPSGDRPQIAISPPSGYAGVYVQIAGNGWPSNELVLVTLSDETGRSGILAASAATSEGQVTTGFLYPISPRWLSAGKHTIVAYTADGNLQAMAEFEVIPGDGVTPVVTIQSPTPTATRSVVQTPTAPSTPGAAAPTSTPSATASPTNLPTPIAITDWRGDYWANSTLSGEPALVRNDTAVFFDWGSGAPASTLPVDQFSARWTRQLSFDAGVYQFFLEVDDGARLFIDDQLVLDEWQAGSQRISSATVPLAAGRHTLRVEYFERTGQALARFWWERQLTFTGWEGRYYSNPDLQGDPALVRDDAAISFDWGGGSPAASVGGDGFSARWRRTVTFDPGLYRFYARMDDGLRVRVDGELLLDEWQDGPDRTVATDVDLAGGNYQVEVEYYERTGGALVSFWWELAPQPTPTYTPLWTATPTATDLPSATPIPTEIPTNVPTAAPTEMPTEIPTESPTPLPEATATPSWTPTPTSTGTSEVDPGVTVTVTATTTITITVDVSDGKPTPITGIPEIGETLPFTHIILAPLAAPKKPIYQMITSQDEWDELLDNLHPIKVPRPVSRPTPGGRIATPTPSAALPSSSRPIASGELSVSLVPDFAQNVVLVVILGREQAEESVQIVDVRQEDNDLFVKVRLQQPQTSRAALVGTGLDGVVVPRDFLPPLEDLTVYFVDEFYQLLDPEERDR